MEETPMKTRNLILTTVACLACVTTALSAKETATEAKATLAAKTPKIEVVFVLDTTGSMGGLIAAAKEKIWAIANTLATAKPAPVIKMGLIGYRDRGDAYITTFSELSDDLDAVYSDLMTFKAAGGGDGPESVNQALHEAVTKPKWSDDTDTYKVIFLVGDAPPHMDYDNDIKYAVSAKKAITSGIVVNTIQCGNMGGTEAIWREIAKLAEGEYFRVAQSGSAVHYRTPYDDDISKLSRELDGTRLYYGAREVQAKGKVRLEKSVELYDEAAPSAVAQRSMFNSSAAGKRNFLGENELVDAYINDTVKLDELKEEELPESLRKMSKEEREAVIKKKAETRKELQKKIAELSKKRQAHILEQVKKQGDKGKKSLDMKIYSAIKKQAEQKDIVYEGGPKY